MMVEMPKQGKVNISVSNAVAISESLEAVFGKDRIAFIGGRAVNIWCYNNTRDTLDIDIAVKLPAGKGIDSFDEAALANGFTPKAEKGGKRYYSQFGRIDLYYKDREINGISIDYIVGTAERMMPLRDRDRSIRVASPAVLVLMKYDTGREKDIADIANIIQQQYSGDARGFMEKEKETLNLFLADRVAFERDIAAIMNTADAIRASRRR